MRKITGSVPARPSARSSRAHPEHEADPILGAPASAELTAIRCSYSPGYALNSFWVSCVLTTQTVPRHARSSRRWPPLVTVAAAGRAPPAQRGVPAAVSSGQRRDGSSASSAKDTDDLAGPRSVTPAAASATWNRRSTASTSVAISDGIRAVAVHASATNAASRCGLLPQPAARPRPPPGTTAAPAVPRPRRRQQAGPAAPPPPGWRQQARAWQNQHSSGSPRSERN